MAKPGPIGANYAGCCIRTSENSPSTTLGEENGKKGGPGNKGPALHDRVMRVITCSRWC
jgi:hypothetical protein